MYTTFWIQVNKREIKHGEISKNHNQVALRPILSISIASECFVYSHQYHSFGKNN